MEIGVITLGELLSDPRLGKKISPRKRLEEILEAARLADQAGLDVFGVGEHHRLDFVVSAVPVVLAAIAQRTRRIRLTSALPLLLACKKQGMTCAWPLLIVLPASSPRTTCRLGSDVRPFCIQSDSPPSAA
jgi:hypothetical protein